MLFRLTVSIFARAFNTGTALYISCDIATLLSSEEIGVSKEIVRPSQLMYMCDGMGIEPAVYQGYWDYPDASTATTPTPRHFDTFQMVFCDGHVDGGPLDTFYRPQYMVRNYGDE